MSYGNDRSYRDKPSIPGNAMMLFLVLLNASIFLLIPRDSELMGYLVMYSGEGVLLEPWRFLTAVFLHGSFSHLFFNMFGLFIFGQLIATRLGGRKLLWLFLVSGVLGNVLWYILSFFGAQGGVLLGASGAVMGVVAASAMLEPNVEMLILFIPFPVKLKVLAVVYFALDVAGEIFSASPVAFTAHIGGFLAGILFIRLFAKNEIEWDPLKALFGKKGPSRPLPGTEYASSRNDELGRILEKLSRTGINSLSETELEILRREHEKMKRENER